MTHAPASPPPLCSRGLADARRRSPQPPRRRRLIIKGRGYGHGIGMSQYGALGFAQHGHDLPRHPRPLLRADRVVPLAEQSDVRVLLQTRAERGRVQRRRSQAGERALERRAARYSVGAHGRRRAWSCARPRAGSWARTRRRCASRRRPAALRLRGDRRPTACATARYRGALEVRPAGRRRQRDQRARPRGLRPRRRRRRERRRRWPAEALKAQAVAARTYAVTTSAGATTDGFDQYADTRSQMYGGVAAEAPSTDAAVAATAGQVVDPDGKPVTTYFFSTSGGHTENVEYSFLGALPQAVAQGRRRPVRRRLAAPQLGAAHHHRRPGRARQAAGWSGARSAGSRSWSAARRRASCAPRSHGTRGRHARSPGRSCARASGSSTRGRSSATSRRPPSARPSRRCRSPIPPRRPPSTRRAARRPPRPPARPPGRPARRRPARVGDPLRADPAGEDGRLLRVQVRARGRWHTLRQTPVGKDGAYGTTLRAAAPTASSTATGRPGHQGTLSRAK